MEGNYDQGTLGIESEEFGQLQKFFAGFFSGQIYFGAYKHASGLSAQNRRPLVDNLLGLLGSNVAEMEYDNVRCASTIDAFLTSFHEYSQRYTPTPSITGFVEYISRAFTPAAVINRIGGRDRIQMVARSSICAVAQRVYDEVRRSPKLCQRICERDESVVGELQALVASRCVERRLEVSAMFAQKMSGVNSSEFAQVADEIQRVRGECRRLEAALKAAGDVETQLRNENERMRGLLRKMYTMAEESTTRESELASQIMEMRSAKSSMLDTMKRWKQSYDTATVTEVTPDDSASQWGGPRVPAQSGGANISVAVPPEAKPEAPKDPPEDAPGVPDEVKPARAPRPGDKPEKASSTSSKKAEPILKATKRQKKAQSEITVSSVLEDFDAAADDFNEYFGE